MTKWYIQSLSLSMSTYSTKRENNTMSIHHLLHQMISTHNRKRGTDVLVLIIMNMLLVFSNFFSVLSYNILSQGAWFSKYAVWSNVRRAKRHVNSASLSRHGYHAYSLYNNAQRGERRGTVKYPTIETFLLLFKWHD